MSTINPKYGSGASSINPGQQGVLLKTESDGTIKGFVQPDGRVAKVGLEVRPSGTFALMIGSDHADRQNWGVKSDGTTTKRCNGLMKMLLDGGLKPYLAVTTGAECSHAPDNVSGQAVGMSWPQVKELKRIGVEVVSHANQHIQRWDRVNTGIFIGYRGANGTATCQITATQIILTAGSDSATVTRSSYSTIAQLIAGINASAPGAVWDSYIRDDSALLGTESQAMLLPISGARDVKSAGALYIDSRLFCCGGGLAVYTGPAFTVTTASNIATQPEHVKMRVRGSSGYLEISIDGVIQWYGDLAAVANDTFTKLMNVLNTALNPKGLFFNLSDNGRNINGIGGANPTGVLVPQASGFVNYMQGDELSISMRLTTLQDRNITPANAAILPVMIEVGVTQDYIRERHYDKSIARAAANDVKIEGFAEPGNQWFPWLSRAYSKFKFWRGTPYSRLDQQPVTYSLRTLSAPILHRSSCIYSGGYQTPAHMVALAEAMADSPGHAACLLWHRVNTIGYTGPYDLGVATGPEDQRATLVESFLAAIKGHLASGKITPTRMGEAADAIGVGAEPSNRLFNANFKNSGTPIALGTINNNSTIPGWLVSFSGPADATAVINADGMIEINSPTGVCDFILQQSQMLSRNNEWQFGADVREATYSAGTGVVVNMLRTMGRVMSGTNLVANQSTTTALTQAGQSPGIATGATGVGGVGGRLALAKPTTGFDAARMVGLAGSFVISATNNTVTLAINGVSSAANLVIPDGTYTLAQMLTQLQNFIQNDATFGTIPEYGDLFKARRGGRAAPVLIVGDNQYVNSIQLGGSAATTLMGGIYNGIGHKAEGYSGADMDAGLYAINYSLQVNVQGRMVLGRPFVKLSEMS